MIKRMFFGLLCLCSYSIVASTNSAEISAQTLAALPNCLHYKVKGVCYWVTQAGVENNTPYVEHYLPDVVVSVFTKPGDNPWAEMNATLDQAGKVAEDAIVSTMAQAPAGGGQHGFNNPLEQNTFFKETDIVGNPALTGLPADPVLLHSTATPLVPYFQSMLDSFLWRGFPPAAEPEEAYAVGAALTRYIGMDGGTISWGSAVPFEGKIETSNDAKAAAVIAQRASNLLTTTNGANWGHLYQPLSTHCGQECTAATIVERSDTTQFQMVYPVADHTCQVFGKTITYGLDAETQTQGAYVWVLWRKYEGCIQGIGTYVGKTTV